MLLEIYDNLVSRELAREIYNSIHQPVYKFGQKSNPGDMFAFWIAPISEAFASKTKPVNRLLEIIDDNITKGQFDIDRMYVNGYDYGNCPAVHVDNAAEGFYTLLYYANPRWQADWYGETVFYNETQDEIVKAVYPTPGRFVFFDSRMPHSARAPSRSCDSIRYTIAVKLIKN